jgi:hypothetical protein
MCASLTSFDCVVAYVTQVPTFALSADAHRGSPVHSLVWGIVPSAGRVVGCGGGGGVLCFLQACQTGVSLI